VTVEMEVSSVVAGPAGLPRVLPPVPVRGLGAHDERYGPARLRGAALVDEVERSGLTGRGGAAFPAGRKLRSVAERSGRFGRSGFPGRRGAVLIANGVESEPASAKDASLLARAPHLVLDGVVLAAGAVSAEQAYLCVSRPGQAEALSAAVAERDDRDPVPVAVTTVPERYVASEESALTHYLNGGPAVPLLTPPRPFERGVRGRPTLVSNVETLANVALISRYGADWFRSLGVSSAPGSALVTITGAVRRPGVYEIALGTPMRDVLALAGGPDAALQAVLAGGYFGSWLPASMTLNAAASAPGLRAAGASFGAGVLLVLPAGGCGLAETARVVRYLAGQSAGQCGPCLNGLPEIAAVLERAAFAGATGRVLRTLHNLCGLVEGRGACHLPDGVARLVASALRVFADDVRRHQRGPCPGARGRPVFAVPSGADAPPAGSGFAADRQ
jgi:NADH:ubiquinone oxidoreductase subunit F (NADH-binding)